jgi:3-oxoacyl-[acyl-carrier-protein] synthase II
MSGERCRPCVTGMGVVTPIGQNPESFWNALMAGTSGAGAVRSFDTSRFKSNAGCEIIEYTLPDAVRPYATGGRCTELALLAAAQAVDDAGLGGRIDGAADIGLVVGTTMGDVTGFEQDRAAHSDRRADDRELASLAHRPLDLMVRAIARMYSLSGPCTTVPTACAAGAYAIGMAASLVARGRLRAAIAVGCEAFSRLAFVGFSRLGAMSPDLCRPFSGRRRGLLLGEGAAAVIVESEASARARGAEVAGFIDGFGISCDAFHVTGPHPEGAGAARATENALREAGLPADRVDYVNAHGTGTLLNDKMESLAIRRVFGERAPRLPVSSIKALTGHMMGAAGSTEAVASLLALRHGVIPPTWNWLEPDPECAIDCVPNEPRPARLRHVVSNSYAFGGNNASLLLTSPAAAGQGAAR